MHPSQRLLTSESAGALMDVAYVAGSSPARLDKIAHLMDLVWGDKHKVGTWDGFAPWVAPF